MFAYSLCPIVVSENSLTLHESEHLMSCLYARDPCSSAPQARLGVNWCQRQDCKLDNVQAVNLTHCVRMLRC